MTDPQNRDRAGQDHARDGAAFAPVVNASSRPRRILIFVVSYNAERFIESVLARIPDDVWTDPTLEVEVLVIDDQSTDGTFRQTVQFARRNKALRINVLYNPVNQGYGGNQKLGYHYAILKGYDVVLLLHGDGQYPPEALRSLVDPILSGEADAVFGSRMLRKADAIRGGMPVYKWLGNQVLTGFQNLVLGSGLSEFHSGYRAYSVEALKRIPFSVNSDYFDFDTDIIIQLFDTHHRIKEVPIPTFYGEELCRVNGLKYAVRVAWSTLRSRIARLGVAYDPRFDYEAGNTVYTPKFDYPSSHRFAIDRVPRGATVLDIGCGPGFMARALSAKAATVVSVDHEIQQSARESSAQALEVDLNQWTFDLDLATKVDVVLMLDIIEHLNSPEEFLGRLRRRFAADAPTVIVTTGNVAFAPLRLSLLMGQFNYGRRGILDLTHTRLFTASSLRRALIGAGYEILAEDGLPAPWPLAIGQGLAARVLLKLQGILIRLWRGAFSYQLAVVCRPKPTLQQLLDDAQRAAASMKEAMDREPAAWTRGEGLARSERT